MIEQDFNGGYCIASKENYEALVEYGYRTHCDRPFYEYHKSYVIVDDVFINGNHRYHYDLKQFYIVDGKPTWDKPEEIQMETISIDGYEFEKSTEFEVELYSVKNNAINEDEIFGAIKVDARELDMETDFYWFISVWGLDGICNVNSEYDLKPIKKPWYEDENIKFPKALAKDGKVAIVNCYDDVYVAIGNGWIPVTEAEALSLVVEDA